jgi:hypothetical protein
MLRREVFVVCSVDVCVGSSDVLLMALQSNALVQALSQQTENLALPTKRSRYSDWLRAVRPRGWSSSPVELGIFTILDRLCNPPSLLYRG